MFLIFLALIASQKPLRDTTFITTGNDTLWITGDKIWNSTGTITVNYANVDDSLATPKVKADIFSTDDSTYQRFTDDVRIDSTLFVKIVNYAQPMGYYKDFSTVTVGSYNAPAKINIYGQLQINEWNLDSIEIDSARIMHWALGDSIAFYRMQLKLWEIGDSVNYIEIVTEINSDSINYGTGETGNKTKTIAATSNRIVKYPFISSTYAAYWHNRSGASISCRFYEWILYFKAFYSK